uniref:Tn7 reverse transcriptase n=1 Tax=Solanum tuberosum TaxID=4113 RepID=M1CX54_SOLTU
MLKTAGGLGFVDITDWNRTAISEHFWNLCLKKDMLWIQLVHAYYIKGGSVWDLNNSRASCTIKEILNAKRTLEIAGYKKQDVTLRTKFSTKVVYCKLGGNYTKVEWRKLLCNNHGAPRDKFILYLALWKRLLSAD